MFETGEPSTKSGRTRARISAAAIDSFIEHGYPDTTMRKIADAAGVSIGNAYYYFPSKDHLVQELYKRVQVEHAIAARERMATERTLVGRLRAVFETGLETLVPYEHSAAGFLTAMIAPDSPINPLSAESSESRDIAVSLFREAVDGSAHRLPADIADLLPQSLFVMHLALVLRWTYDTSPGQVSTRRLLDSGMRLFTITLPFVRMPGLHAASRELLMLMIEVRS